MANTKIRELRGGPQAVWSNTSTSLYHACSAPIPSTDAAEIRVSQEMANKTAGVTGVKIAARYSNDLVTWDNWGAVSGATAQTSNGTQNDDTWLNVRTGFTIRRFVQLGWEVAAAAATKHELAQMSHEIELKGD